MVIWYAIHCERVTPHIVNEHITFMYLSFLFFDDNTEVPLKTPNSLCRVEAAAKQLDEDFSQWQGQRLLSLARTCLPASVGPSSHPSLTNCPLLKVTVTIPSVPCRGLFFYPPSCFSPSPLGPVLTHIRLPGAEIYPKL